jgi:hypothetical protein
VINSRESIYAALFELISGIEGIVTSDRTLLHWADVPPVQQPALFQVQKTEDADYKFSLPTKWSLYADIYIYAYAKDDGSSASQILNPLIDAVETAIMPEIGQEQTLGGLVSHCRIVGRVETDEGVLGKQGVVIIPIGMLAV